MAQKTKKSIAEEIGANRVESYYDPVSAKVSNKNYSGGRARKTEIKKGADGHYYQIERSQGGNNVTTSRSKKINEAASPTGKRVEAKVKKPAAKKPAAKKTAVKKTAKPTLKKIKKYK